MFGMHGAIMYHPHFSGGKTECGDLGWPAGNAFETPETRSFIVQYVPIFNSSALRTIFASEDDL
jgi:hypothetical protein